MVDRKGNPKYWSHLKQYQFKKGGTPPGRTKETFRKSYYNGPGKKLYDGLTFPQKGLETRMRNRERRRMELEIKNNQLFKEKYGSLFEDNRVDPWEEQ